MGVFLALLIHVQGFRRGVWEGLKTSGRAIRHLVIDFPRWFFALPWVYRIVHSSAVRLALNLVVKPVLPTLLVAAFLPARERPAGKRRSAWRACFSGWPSDGQFPCRAEIEEMLLDALGEGWQRFGVRPIVGLFWFIVDLFRRLMQLVERLLYAVDEWLRFRSGQGRTMLWPRRCWALAGSSWPISSVSA